MFIIRSSVSDKLLLADANEKKKCNFSSEFKLELKIIYNLKFVEKVL